MYFRLFHLCFKIFVVIYILLFPTNITTLLIHFSWRPLYHYTNSHDALKCIPLRNSYFFQPPDKILKLASVYSGYVLAQYNSVFLPINAIPCVFPYNFIPSNNQYFKRITSNFWKFVMQVEGLRIALAMHSRL